MITLIQFRTDQSGWHELKCVYDGLGVPYNQLHVVNATAAENTKNDILEYALRSQSVLIGAWGENGYEATEARQKKKLSRVRRKMIPIIHALYNKRIPTLGFCFGHQLIGDAFGSEIKAEPSMAEANIIPLFLTNKGKNDPLFRKLSNGKILVSTAHKASVVSLPKQAAHLSFTTSCPIQAIRLSNFMYGVQFHPELNADDLVFRLKLYPGYPECDLEYIRKQKVKTKQILKNFIDIARNL